MKRQLLNPNKDMVVINSLAIYEGGTGGKTVAQAQALLDIALASSIGTADGPAIIPQGGLKGSDFAGTTTTSNSVNLVGPVSVTAGQTVTYTISDYDVGTTYTATATNGTVSVSGNVVTFTVGNAAGGSTMTINGRVFNIAVAVVQPGTPSIVTPVNGATSVGLSTTVTASAFVLGSAGETHASSDWEIATDAAFTQVAKSSYLDTVNKTTWGVGGLSATTTYYARVRYHGSVSGASGWSGVVSFGTVATSSWQRIVGTDSPVEQYFGESVSISSDGNTAVVGGSRDASIKSAAYVFTRSGGAWSQQTKLVASDRVAGDYFGVEVAISGDGNTIFVGAIYTASATGGVYVFTRSGNSWVEQAKLTSTESGVNGAFGYTIAATTDGNMFVAGTPGRSSVTGGAEIYVRTGTTWQRQALLRGSDSVAGDEFGHDVAINALGTTVVVSALHADVGTMGDNGATYVFTRTGTTWAQQAKLTDTSQSGSNYQGESVAVSADGTTIAVGAILAGGYGRVFIWRFVNGGWVVQSIFGSDEGVSAPQFGWDLAISANGDKLIVGVNDDVGAGSAFLLERTGTTWVKTAKIVSPDSVTAVQRFGAAVGIDASGDTITVGAFNQNSGKGGVYFFDLLISGVPNNLKDAKVGSDSITGDQFGYNVIISADGNTAAVGADQNGSNSGAVYVFTRSGTIWTQQAKLTQSGTVTGTYLGRALAISANGNTVLAGVENANGTGCVFVFERISGVWEKQTVIVSPNFGTMTEFFGSSVGVSSDGLTAVIGAWAATGVSMASGAAWVFRRNGTSWFPETKLVANNGSTGARFGFASSISGDGNTVVIGAFMQPSQGFVTGNVYVYVFANGGWAQQATLVSSSPSDVAEFGRAVAIAGDGNTIAVGQPTNGTTAVSGSVYIFKRNVSAWVQVARFVASNGTIVDYFGNAVSCSYSGDAVLAGAKNGSGKCYVITRTFDTWMVRSTINTPVTTVGMFGYSCTISGDGEHSAIGALSSPDGKGAVYFYDTTYVEVPDLEKVKFIPTEGGREEFGYAVSLSNNGRTALVCAPYNNAAYVFTQIGDTWTKQAVLRPVDATVGEFGRSGSLSGDGNTIVIGAHAFIGCAFVFVLTGTGWVKQAKLVSAGAVTGDMVGYSVGISNDGNTVIVGSPSNDLVKKGTAIVFSRLNATWSQSASLIAPDGVNGDRFGCAVGISSDGNVILVGASYPNSNNGAAYVFTKTDSVWGVPVKLTAGSDLGGYFGASVCLSGNGDTIVVGAWNANSTIGVAYVFVRSNTTWVLHSKLTRESTGPLDTYTYWGYGVSISTDGNTILVGCYGENSRSGLFYSYTRAGLIWEKRAKCIAGDYSGDMPNFGYSVAVSGDGKIGLAGAPNKGTLIGAAYIFS